MLSTAAIAQLGTQLAGRTLAHRFIKLIPGVGHAVSATVASVLTASISEGWRKLCKQTHLGEVDIADERPHRWYRWLHRPPAMTNANLARPAQILQVPSRQHLAAMLQA